MDWTEERKFVVELKRHSDGETMLRTEVSSRDSWDSLSVAAIALAHWPIEGRPVLGSITIDVIDPADKPGVLQNKTSK